MAAVVVPQLLEAVPNLHGALCCINPQYGVKKQALRRRKQEYLKFKVRDQPRLPEALSQKEKKKERQWEVL